MKEKGGVSHVNLIPTGDPGGYIVRKTINPRTPTVPEDLEIALLAGAPTKNDRQQLEKIIAKLNGNSSHKI